LNGLHPHVHADLLPLVDEPDRDRLVRLRDTPILEGEREALRHTGLSQQPAGLGAGRLDVAPVARELLQLRGRRGPRGPGYLDSAHLLYDGDAREALRRLPAVEGERQGSAHALVVEGLALMVHRHELATAPRALLHRDLRPQRGQERVAVGRTEAAELDVGALAPNGGDLRG